VRNLRQLCSEKYTAAQGEIMAKAFAVMTVICGTVAVIVATIFLGQYLAWHGPEWMMMNNGGHFGIGSIFAIIALIVGEFTIGSLLIGYIHGDGKK
jgi:hypothetical protein